MHINDFVTNVYEQEDIPFLKSVLFDVNMRLYNNARNLVYRQLIKNNCEYLAFCAKQTMEGYTKPYGMSGANIGIPFNIIAVIRNRGNKDEYCEIMLNPKITERSTETEEALTNCGSIRLADSIKIQRNSFVSVNWFDLDGKARSGVFGRKDGGFTIQHEIEHNNGVLITDYVPF